MSPYSMDFPPFFWSETAAGWVGWGGGRFVGGVCQGQGSGSTLGNGPKYQVFHPAGEPWNLPGWPPRHPWVNVSGAHRQGKITGRISYLSWLLHVKQLFDQTRPWSHRLSLPEKTVSVTITHIIHHTSSSDWTNTEGIPFSMIDSQVLYRYTAQSKILQSDFHGTSRQTFHNPVWICW